MKLKGSYKADVFMSSFITLLLVLLVCGLALIVYRVENTLHLEPFVIFTLTNHMNGTYSFTIFNVSGTVDFRWINGLAEKINQFQLFIPSSFKAFTQLISGIIEGAYRLVTSYI
ncbi:hypothetical protein RBG61_04590 [Paludicola sp. MB14-C6]|uniref:hypothetical protein n=1 Tax=Paludihabitans sp. MB14-C6 TaxID=3070656 RepID=UPI0027DADA59|nr:hypothetical protein [Paludicola sp. MB14-C6]WMJ23951.1 hypothetical protein RBG61_04590 [Paludicola sp. MB14-C6]